VSFLSTCFVHSLAHGCPSWTLIFRMFFMGLRSFMYMYDQFSVSLFPVTASFFVFFDSYHMSRVHVLRAPSCSRLLRVHVLRAPSCSRISACPSVGQITCIHTTRLLFFEYSSCARCCRSLLSSRDVLEPYHISLFVSLVTHG
jgi:hypothetical protein